MVRLRGGDMEALATLVRRHQQQVRSLAYRLTGRWDAADDVAQEAFLRLYRGASRYQPAAAFTTWLYRIVVNLCLDLLKRRRPRPLDTDVISDASSASDGLLQQERIDAIRSAVAGLPERQRTVIVLHRFESLSHEQIAEVTGWSTSAVESLLVRAYGRLREELGGWAEK